jgi:hypothetical protein
MAGPSKLAESLVAIFLPPACREEVLGDLWERFRSPGQYALDALCTVPCVIVSRIRRTSDPQVVLIQAFALYLSFLGAAWFLDDSFLAGKWGLLRLAVPAAVAMFGLMIVDAYSHRKKWIFVQAPCLGIGLAFIAQAILSTADLALPRLMMLYGGGMSLLLSSALRLVFPPVVDQLQGANVPAYWLERSGGPVANPLVLIRILKWAVTLIAVALIATLVRG